MASARPSAVVALLAAGCGYIEPMTVSCEPDTGEDSGLVVVTDTGGGDTGSPPRPTAEADCGDPLLTWETVGDPFVRTWCTSCHSSALAEEHRQGAPVGVDFDSYDNVIAYAARIEARVTSDDAPMPPAGTPDADEEARFLEWLACEAQ